MSGEIEITNRLHKIEVMNMCRDFSVSETFTDVQLISKGGRKVFAHRLVLGSVSRLLQKILTDMPELEGMTTIHLPDVSYRTLRLVINFLYIGSMRLNTTEKVDFVAALDLLQVDIQMKINDPNPSTETSPTSPTVPKVMKSDQQPVQQQQQQQQSNMAAADADAALQEGPIVVNSFSQNPLALLGLMGNGTQNFQHVPIAIAGNNQLQTNGSTEPAQQNMNMELATVSNAMANCLNSRQQLVQVVPIAFANQFATSAANLMTAAGGGATGLVAVANLPACSSTVGSQLQLQPSTANGPLQLAAITATGSDAEGGLRLMATSTPIMTTIALPSGSVTSGERGGGGGAGGGEGAVIDLSTDDDSRLPPSTADASTSSPASDCISPNRSRRKRQADPEAAAQLAKRLHDAGSQQQTSAGDIIDLD